MEYYSALERNTVESVLIRWMNLEPINRVKFQSEREKQISYTNIRNGF